MAVFAVHYMPKEQVIKAGQVSPSTIKAPQTLTFEDPKKTAERKQAARDSVGEVYVLDRKVMKDMEDSIEQVFNEYQRIVRRDNIDTKEKIRLLKREYNLSDMAANILLYMEQDTMKALKAEALNLLRTNWQMGVRDFEVEEKRTKILNQIELLNYNAPYRDLIKAVFQKVELLPNYKYDEAATMKAKEEAAESEGPVLVTIRKGQKIVGEGEVVTDEQVEILEALGYQKTTSPYIALGGISILLILNMVLTALFLKYFRKDIYAKNNSIVLLSLIVFIMILLAKLIVSVRISAQPEVSALVGYLVPVAAGSMLITILMDNKLAVFTTVILSGFVGILNDNQLFYAINAFVGGLVGVYSVSRFSQRLDWVRAGLYVAAADMVCIFALGLMSSHSWQLLLTGMLLGIMSGFFSAIFAYGSLPFFEQGFKVTTSVRLMELANPNQPLLKKLLMEAPGTYHHSILVGNLGEAAADIVGADSLLVRVGAYYHDIGKLKRPYFFIENQLGGDNAHQKLTPALSTLIITAHVKDGLELANKYGMPPVIMDIIAQHHGTSLVTFFYHKALEMGNADNVKESDFRYDAPKPQSKEAAIVMLADNVEAAVRSMTAVTPEKIEGLVRKIIKERLQDGQLDESALTFKDLDLISGAFTRILNGIFHNRIEYPDSVLEKMEGEKRPDADTDRQSAAAGESDGEN
jgi:putative nucleotidyltransferase with HDIG domain